MAALQSTAGADGAGSWRLCGCDVSKHALIMTPIGRSRQLFLSLPVFFSPSRLALARHATLATRNVRHFQDLNVPVVDPWKAKSRL